MRKKLHRGIVLVLAFMLPLTFLLAGCAGGNSKGQTVADTAFESLHEKELPEIALSGDFTLTYTCKVENESGTLDESELELDLGYEGTTLHMPIFNGKTYLEYADGTTYEFTEADKAKSRKEAGSVYSSNKVPGNEMELTVTLSRSGDVISGGGTYEGGAMGKGTHQFWIYHYYSDVKLPEDLVLLVTGQDVSLSEIQYVVE